MKKSFYPTGYEKSLLGVEGTSSICDMCCGNNCASCKSPIGTYDPFKIMEAEDEYYSNLDFTKIKEEIMQKMEEAK